MAGTTSSDRGAALSAVGRAAWWRAGVAVLLVAAGARAQGVFDVGRQRATDAIVTLTPDEPIAASAAEGSTMLRRLAGVLAVLDRKELDRLRACAGPPEERKAAAGEADDTTPFAFVHLRCEPKKATTSRSSDAAVKVVELRRAADGTFLARELAGSEDGKRPPRSLTLHSEAIAPIVQSWPMYRGSYPGSGRDANEKAASDAVPLGSVFELGSLPGTAPVSGVFLMDARTMGQRLLGGRSTRMEPMKRVLGDEKFFVRLPSKYSKLTPPGVLVWVDASPVGRPPEGFFETCDTMNLVCVGAANSGNDRPTADRLQLALDGVASVSTRFHVDPTRVFVTGISGGGKIASMLQGGFPDVFTGCVPIVGLACYENVPAGSGKFYAGNFGRPEAKMFDLLRTRRIAAITGDQDFNQAPIRGAAAVYEKDKCDIKVYSYPDMAHQMPTKERFAEALHWVDEPIDRARTKALREAQAALDEVVKARADASAPLSDAQRAALQHVTAIAPWSEPAWRAAELMEK